MYLYLYDTFLNNKKYDKILSKIETRITDLGISGKITRLSPISTPSTIINQEVRHGIKTVVAVGSDDLFCKIITTKPDQDTIYGFIPLNKSCFSNLLGIPCGPDACDVISARIISTIDVGKINNRNFISYLKLSSINTVITCDNLYSITIPNKPAIILIKNLFSNHLVSNPTDGFLELVIQECKESKLSIKKMNNQESKFFCKYIKIKSLNSESICINVDGVENVNTPATIAITPQDLKIIVGKNRIIKNI